MSEKNDTCPNCGYCPHCGRSAAPMYPIYPHYARPWWTMPWYGNGTVTMGSGAVTSGHQLTVGNTVPFDPNALTSWTGRSQ